MGEKNGRCIVGDADCLRALEAREAGISYAALCAHYGVSRWNMWRILTVRAPAIRAAQYDRTLAHFLSRPPWT